MRKLIYSMTVSLDGFIAGPDGAIDWSVPDEELFRFHHAASVPVSVDGLGLDTVLHRGGLPRWLAEAVQQQRWENPEAENPSGDQHCIHQRARVAKL